MFEKKKWVAVVRENHWIVAKAARRKLKVKILRLAEKESESPEELKEWLSRQKVPLKDLEIAISASGIITRIITLPLLAPKDLEVLLTEHVDQYFTLNIADYIVDYRVLENIEEDGQKRQRVLLAALPKTKWTDVWATFEQIGFRPGVVDLASNSLARVYARLGNMHLSKGDSHLASDIAIVDLNPDRVEIVLLEHGVFFLYSDLEIGAESLVEMRRELALGTDGDSRPHGETNDIFPEVVSPWRAELPRSIEVRIQDETEQALQPVLQILTEFFNFFAARHFGKAIDKIYLTGELADLPFLNGLFESNLGVETKVGFPYGWRPEFRRRAKKQKKNWMKYGNLYGLALRED